jgi:hypothetical protein
MKVKYFIFVWLILGSCSKKEEPIKDIGSVDGGIHEIHIHRKLFGDMSNIHFYYSFNQKMIFLIDTLKKERISYFTDSNSCNKYIRILDSSFSMNGYDFHNYILVPFFIDDFYGVSTTYFKCFLNHSEKQATVFISNRGSVKTSGNYYGLNWLSVPKLPQGYNLIVNSFSN